MLVQFILEKYLKCQSKVKAKYSKLNFGKEIFHFHFWIQHEKYIQSSTSKPSIGSVVLEIAHSEKILLNLRMIYTVFEKNIKNIKGALDNMLKFSFWLNSFNM